ncbi:MAG: hypothetical protein CL878_08865 [Dehalococcoidia bacterium]|nr:hypothetical protein [Dehalococcoidia bacterium]
MRSDRAMPVKAVLFDWGDTLGPVSAERGIAALPSELVLGRRVLELAASRLHLDAESNPGLKELEQIGWEPPAEAWRETTAREYLQTAYQLAGRPWPADPARERALVLRHSIILIASMRAAPGAVGVLAKLRSRGLRLGLVSNVTENADVVRALLDRDSLLPYLGVIVCSSSVGVPKPHPAIYQAALDGLGVSAEQTVFVGDRILQDIAGPRRQGMRAILTQQHRQETPPTSGLGRPNATVGDLREILGLLPG